MRSFAAFGATSRFLLLIFLISLGARADGNASVPSQIPSAPSQETSAPPSPAPTQNSTTTYHLSPEKYQKAIAYSRAGYRLYFLSVLWSFAVLLSLLRSGLIAKLGCLCGIPRSCGAWR